MLAQASDEEFSAYLLFSVHHCSPVTNAVEILSLPSICVGAGLPCSSRAPASPGITLVLLQQRRYCKGQQSSGGCWRKKSGQQSLQELVWFTHWLGLKRWHRAERAPVLQLSLLAGVLPVGVRVLRLLNVVLPQLCGRNIAVCQPNLL